jgi:hypothetical protein
MALLTGAAGIAGTSPGSTSPTAEPLAALIAAMSLLNLPPELLVVLLAPGSSDDDDDSVLVVALLPPAAATQQQLLLCCCSVLHVPELVNVVKRMRIACKVHDR